MEYLIAVGNVKIKLKSKTRAWTVYHDAGIEVNKILCEKEGTDKEWKILKSHLGGYST